MSKYIAGENYNYLFPLEDKNDVLKKNEQNFILKIKSAKNDGQCLDFEIINAPGIFHNTLRRLILNEVPSVAIDRIFLYNNTGVLEDTDLQLRVGLVPIEVDPDMLKMWEGNLPNSNEDVEALKADSCLLFELIMKYKKREYIRSTQLKATVDQFVKVPTPKYIENFNNRVDMSVYSNDFKWIPLESQGEVFTNIKAVEGILLDRIMPGEEIDMKCLAVKGFGHDHAKFIPVSAAHGRMAHKIVLDEKITGKDAEKLQSLFPKGVIKIKNNRAVVGNTLLMQRTNKNFNDIESLKGKVELSFDENHYIWKVESVRPKCQPAHKILSAGMQAMIDKCSFYVNKLEKLKEEMNNDKTASFVAKSKSEKHLGKMCYVEIIKPKGNPKFPMYHFIGETATLGAILSHTITKQFGEEVLSAYTDIHDGIELTLEIVGTKTDIDTTEILILSLISLSNYFSHAKNCFEKEYSAFTNTDVEME